MRCFFTLDVVKKKLPEIRILLVPSSRCHFNSFLLNICIISSQRFVLCNRRVSCFRDRLPIDRLHLWWFLQLCSLDLGPTQARSSRLLSCLKWTDFIYKYLKQMKIYHLNHMCFLQEPFVASQFLASIVAYISPKPQ